MTATKDLWKPVLVRTPEAWTAKGFQEKGVEAFFLKGPPWRGRTTRVFAWYGRPEKVTDPVPAMVLVHGSGGTAFAEWVRLWNARGYAAIAMDTSGTLPGGLPGERPRNPEGGPASQDLFEQMDEPVGDQWPYHGVAAIVAAHSWLRVRPGVDPSRIGLMGISVGAILSCIAAGVDSRFRLVIPVYGCGFLGEKGGVWQSKLDALGSPRRERWLELWDPQRYLPFSRVPMLWMNGTNDFAFPLSAWQKSYRAARGPRTLCARVRMSHGHASAWTPPESGLFADSVLLGTEPLPRLTAQRREGCRLQASFASGRPALRAELNFTRDAGAWAERRWETTPAELAPGGAAISAEAPEGTSAAYLNLVSEGEVVVSAEHGVLNLAENDASAQWTRNRNLSQKLASPTETH